jgi:hypothetical protein
MISSQECKKLCDIFVYAEMILCACLWKCLTIWWCIAIRELLFSIIGGTWRTILRSEINIYTDYTHKELFCQKKWYIFCSPSSAEKSQKRGKKNGTFFAVHPPLKSARKWAKKGTFFALFYRSGLGRYLIFSIRKRAPFLESSFSLRCFIYFFSEALFIIKSTRHLISFCPGMFVFVIIHAVFKACKCLW